MTRSANLAGTVVAATDSTALTQFSAGLNQERAKQYAMAVISFQGALKTGSQLLPAEIIGDHLEAIKAAHPQEFEQGMQLALNPPTPRVDPFGRPIYDGRSGFSYPPGPMERAASRATPAPETLVVPATPARATPAPASPAPAPSGTKPK